MLLPKKDESSLGYHLPQGGLLLLSIILLPFTASITLLALLLNKIGLFEVRRRKLQNNAPKVLVSGIGMSKGLFVIRTMYLGGCDVYGADFDNNQNLYCGRFSKSIKRFFPLKNPDTCGVDKYISQVIHIVNEMQIDLWISCSRVTASIEDSKLAKALREHTNCKVFQFNEDVISTLDDKLNFMRKTSEIGFSRAQWYSLESVNDIHDVLEKIKKTTNDDKAMKFIIKSARMDDTTRNSLPLVNSEKLQEAEKVLKSLDYSSNHQWILQEFIESREEYCTNGLIVDGQLRAFTACPSTSVLLHYQQLNPDSIVYQNMLQFTQEYATSLGNITGHLSFDFLASYRKTINGFEVSMVPIECNPRCHTANILLHGKEVELADRYLESLDGIKNTPLLETRLKPGNGFYWMAHDLVTLGASPILHLVSGTSSSDWKDQIHKLLSLLEHLLTWKDPTFSWWDPLPWFVLYHLYWPWELAIAYFHGVKWKLINVSTGKIFKK